MATSRTGTARYKRNSNRALHAAQVANLTHCPCKGNCKQHRGRTCNVPLDYTNRRRPNGASVEHVQAWATGGTDDVTNLTIICLRCNETLGDKRQRTKRQHVPTIEPATTGRRPGMPH